MTSPCSIEVQPAENIDIDVSEMNKSSRFTFDIYPRHGASVESPYIVSTDLLRFKLMKIRWKDEYTCHCPNIGGERSKKHNGTVFFDLDHTLLRSETLDRLKDGGYNRVFNTATGCPRGVFIRPGTKELLELVNSMDLEIIFFTAATSDFATEYRCILDPEGKYVSYVLSRNSCEKHNNKVSYYVKNIGRFRDLERSVIVDDDIINFTHNIMNGIPIRKFEAKTIEEAMMDEELAKVGNVLKSIFEYKDVRVRVWNNVGYEITNQCR